MDRANIHDFWTHCKVALDGLIRDWGLILIVFLVAFVSFGLGRLSAQEASKSAISVSQAGMEAQPKGMAIGGLYEASRTGTVYYFPWCGGATSIKPENQVWFKTEDAAKAAGYVAAKNCKGLVQ